MLDFDGKLVRAVPWWERAPAWNTIVRLRNRKVPYVQELKVDGESCVRLTAAGRAHYEDHLDRYRAAYPEVRVPGPDSPEALHRGDPGQLHADAERRRQLYALSEAEVQARIAGNEAEAVRLHAEAGILRRPSACGHWLGRDHRVSLGNQAIGASCGQPVQATSVIRADDSGN